MNRYPMCWLLANLERQVGTGLVDFVKALGTDVDSAALLSLLSDSLTGRTWEGKEALLEALCTTVVEGKEFFTVHPKEKEMV